ncbi:hypothetical protein SBV42_00880 [Chlamydia crocodili]|uniref:Uncharacterized protein n=1 Tax=Chlamydia crocodili TaxID=2766982 RepID=A0ABX8CGB7_9CHLA|nr:hypothetical protein [Chlamydia crocodili]QVE49323.1 hypothetical protein H9Q19_01255 [Chlamydia crocodili]
MKNVPSCRSDVELTCVQRCCFSESRVHKVANVVAIVVGLLILAGGLVCSVLFGAELGMFYTMIVLGISVAVGILLLTSGVCLSCRALASKTRKIDRKDLPKYDSQISKIKQEITETTKIISKAEEDISRLFDEYNKVKLEHKSLVGSKNQASKKLEIASKKCSEARTDLNSLLEKLQKDSSSSGGGGVTSLVLKKP